MPVRRKLPPAKHLLRVVPRDEDAVLALVEVIASGRWQTGISTRRYADTWGVSESKVLEWYRAACLTSRIAVSADSVMRVWDEMLTSMAGMHHRLGDETSEHYDPRASIAAGKTVIDACTAFMKIGSDREERKTEAQAHAHLIEMGWRPPTTLEGLPEPNVMGPDDSSVVVGGRGLTDDGEQENDGTDNNEENVHGEKDSTEILGE